jgi:hypothetical protein
MSEAHVDLVVSGGVRQMELMNHDKLKDLGIILLKDRRGIHPFFYPFFLFILSPFIFSSEFLVYLLDRRAHRLLLISSPEVLRILAELPSFKQESAEYLTKTIYDWTVDDVGEW